MSTPSGGSQDPARRPTRPPAAPAARSPAQPPMAAGKLPLARTAAKPPAKPATTGSQRPVAANAGAPSAAKQAASPAKPATPTAKSPRVTTGPAAPVNLPAEVDGYVVESLLGVGGAGEVFAVRDPAFDREVALKRAQAQHRQSRRSAHRFAAEGRLMGQLQHPTVPPVFHLAQEPDGTWYYTLLRVRGRTLADILKERKKDPRCPWTLRRLLEVYVTICSGIAYAHSRGVIHRDLKPHNIMLGEFGQVYVLDWGLAKILGRNLNIPAPGQLAGLRLYTAPRTLYEEYLDAHPGERRTDTQAQPVEADAFDDGDETIDADAARESARLAAAAAAATKPSASGSDETPVRLWQPANPADAAVTLQGTVMGTPQYMAPEQARGDVKFFDQRADIYALGAILYEILTGRKLRGGLDATGAIKSARSGARPDFTRVRGGRRIEPDLREICERALEPEMFTRYGSVPALVADLRSWLDGERHWKLIYDADFSKQPDQPGPLPGWKEQFGKWSIRNGALLLEANQGAGGSILHLNHDITGDVRVEMIGEVAAGSEGELSIFVGAPVNPERRHKDDGYCVQFGADHRQLAKLSRHGVDVHVVEDERLDTGRSYVLLAEQVEGRVRLEVDGREIFAYRDLFPLCGARVGLYAWGLGTRIRRFRVFSAGVPRQRPALAVPDVQAARGQWAAAVEEYDRVAIGHPGSEESDEAVFKAGMCLLELNRFPEAAARFDQLLETPAAALGWVGRSAVLQRQQAPAAQEIELLCQALGRYKNAQAEGFQDLVTRTITRCTFLMEERDFKPAQAGFEVVAKHPALPRGLRARAWLSLARCLTSRNKQSDTRKVYEAILRAYPEQRALVHKVYDGLMLSLIVAGDWPRVFEVIADLQQRDPAMVVWLYRRLTTIPAEFQHLELPPVAALVDRIDHCIESGFQLHREDREAQALLTHARAMLHFTTGRIDSASRLLQQYIDQFHEFEARAEIFGYLIWGHTLRADPRRAHAVLQQAKTEYPADPIWIQNEIRLLFATGQIQQGIQLGRANWNKGLDLRPSNPQQVYHEVLRGYRLSGQWDEMWTLCREVAAERIRIHSPEAPLVSMLWLALLEHRGTALQRTFLDQCRRPARPGSASDRTWATVGVAEVFAATPGAWNRDEWNQEITPLRAIHRTFGLELAHEFRSMYDYRAGFDPAWASYALQARQGLAPSWQQA